MLIKNHQRGAGGYCSSRNSKWTAVCLLCKPVNVASEVRLQSEQPISHHSNICDALHVITPAHIVAADTASSGDSPVLARDVSAHCGDAQKRWQHKFHTHVQQQQQEQQQSQQLQQQKQREKQVHLPLAEHARQLTTGLTATANVTELLLMLAEHISQLDHIHVSAATKHACRKLQLTVAVPERAPQQQASQQSPQQPPQQQQQHQTAFTLQWLQQLHIRQVQLHLSQRQQQDFQGQNLLRDEQQSWQHWQGQCVSHSADCHRQQHDQLHQVVQQQLQPQTYIQHQLTTARYAQQQQQLQQRVNSSTAAVEGRTETSQHGHGVNAPSDDWLLLLLLSQLVIQHSSSMASQQLCTCLNSLTHLLLTHPTLPLLGQPLYRTALQQLLHAAGQQMQQFDHRALSVLMHSAAVIASAPLGFAPLQGYMRQWYRCSRAAMAQCGGLDLAMAAWGLGRLGAHPPTQWTCEFFTHSKVAIPALQPQELLLLLLGVAGMERTPRRSTTAAAARAGWVPAAAQQLQLHVHKLTPHQLSGALLALLKLQYQPSKKWLAAFAHAWESQQSQFTTKGHSMVLWGVGSMSQAEAGSREARVAWARQIQAALQQAVSRAATAVAAVALLKLRHAKEQQQQQQAVHHEQVQQQEQQELATEQGKSQQRAMVQQEQDQQKRLHAQQQQQQQGLMLYQEQQDSAAAVTKEQLMQHLQHQLQLHQPLAAQQEPPQPLSSACLLHPTDCAMVVYGLARLGPSCLEPEFASFWLRQSKSQLPNMNSQELASCLWALGRLGLRPPADWLQQHLACAAQLAPCMSHQQLAMLLWGLAKLQYLPDVSVTAELLMSAAEQLPSFSSHSLALLMYALGLLRMKPNKELMQLLLEQARNKFMRFDGQDLCGLLLGLYRLRYNPGQQWLGLYAQTLAAKVHLLPAKKHALIVQVLRAMGYTCKGKAFAWVMDEAAVAAMCNRDSSSVKQRRKSSQGSARSS